MTDRIYPRPGKTFYWEQAIKMHIEGQRASIKPQNSSMFNEHKKLHIKTIEGAPGDSAYLYMRIADKKKQKDTASDIIQVQTIIVEIDALERLLGMVRKNEKGESLDGLAY